MDYQNENVWKREAESESESELLTRKKTRTELGFSTSLINILMKRHYLWSVTRKQCHWMERALLNCYLIQKGMETKWLLNSLIPSPLSEICSSQSIKALHFLTTFELSFLCNLIVKWAEFYVETFIELTFWEMRMCKSKNFLWFNEKFGQKREKKNFNDFNIKTSFRHFSHHQKLSLAKKSKTLTFSLQQAAPSRDFWDGKKSKSSCILYRLFHQVPDSLLIFRLFSKSVWISIVITVITVALAYTILLTMIDVLEGNCECKTCDNISFSNH